MQVTKAYIHAENETRTRTSLDEENANGLSTTQINRNKLEVITKL